MVRAKLSGRWCVQSFNSRITSAKRSPIKKKLGRVKNDDHVRVSIIFI